jgi:hypothetical protein
MFMTNEKALSFICREPNEVLLRFKFKDNEYIRQRRYQPFTVVEFLAQSGGLLGLFIGASVLSIVEMFYFFSLRTFSFLVSKVKMNFMD